MNREQLGSITTFFIFPLRTFVRQMLVITTLCFAVMICGRLFFFILNGFISIACFFIVFCVINFCIFFIFICCFKIALKATNLPTGPSTRRFAATGIYKAQRRVDALSDSDATLLSNCVVKAWSKSSFFSSNTCSHVQGKDSEQPNYHT